MSNPFDLRKTSQVQLQKDWRDIEKESLLAEIKRLREELALANAHLGGDDHGNYEPDSDE